MSRSDWLGIVVGAAMTALGFLFGGPTPGFILLVVAGIAFAVWHQKGHENGASLLSGIHLSTFPSLTPQEKQCPKIAIERYVAVGHGEAHCALMLTNEGAEAGFDVLPESFRIGGYTVLFDRVARISPGQTESSRISIVEVPSQRTSCLEWAMANGSESVARFVTQVEFEITYTNFGGERWRSLCALHFNFGTATVDVQFLRQEKIYESAS